jgi:hypothetical protein
MNHALSSWVKQDRISDVVHNFDWNLDLASGFLSFSDKYRWQTQLLGTVSDSSNDWLWAWANIQSNISDHLLEACRALKAYGEQHGIPELTMPHLSLDQVDGHTLALLASGICEANAYYRCPCEGGSLYILIMDENFPKCSEPLLQRIASAFPQAISNLDIPDHKLALTSYLDHCCLVYEQDGEKLVVKENGEPVLTATFDELNRLTNLEVRLNADTTTAKPQSWDEGQLRRLLGW